MRNIFRNICLVCIIVILNSCEKKLDLFPQTTYSESTFFTTPEQYKLFVNQFYSQLPDVNYGSSRDTYSDLRAAWGGANNISNSSYSPSPNSGLWQSSYAIIRNTSYLIGKAEEALEELRNQIGIFKGEAHFFRALAYYNLYKDFGGVPLIDRVLSLDDQELLYGPRSDRSVIVDYILDDLNAAIAMLQEESDIAGNDKGRVSRDAALALKARVALFEGTWLKSRGQDGNALLDIAIDASDMIISGNQYQLFDRKDVLGDSSYRYFFILDKVLTNPAGLTKSDQREYILTNRYDNTLRASPVNSVHGSASPTQKFADMFLCKDGLPIDKSPLFEGYSTVTSEYQNRDPRMSNSMIQPFTRFWSSYPPEYGRNWANPYAGGNIYDVNFGNTTNTGYLNYKFLTEIAPPLSVDYPVIRFAEVLLINAEAKFERNGSISDADLDITINQLRKRAGVADLTNALASAHDLDMRTEIRRERTIELYMEGFRFDDLRRWKTAETEMSMALKGVVYAGTQYSTDPRWSDINFTLDADGRIIVESSDKRKFSEKHYLFPLPTHQILLNDQLEQNDGWK